MSPDLSNTHCTNVISHDSHQVPSVRLISATPSAAGLSADASTSFSRSFESSWTSASPSTISPKPDAPTRKRLVPKKSKLALLSSKGEAKNLSDNDRQDRTSTRRSFNIHIDQINDPELEDVIVLKRPKSRKALNGLKWGALGEVTNIQGVSRGCPASSNTSKTVQDKKWWSIGRGRKASKEIKNQESGKENELHVQFRMNQSKTLSSKQEWRPCLSTLDSIPLSNPNPLHAKASEETSRPCRTQRSFTPESLRETFHASSPSRPAFPIRKVSDTRDHDSIAVRAIRSVKSLARLGGWSHLGVNENGVKEGTIKGKKAKEKEKGGEGKREKREKGGEDKRGKREKKEKKDKEKGEKGEKKKKKREQKVDKEKGEGTIRGKGKKERKEDNDKREKREKRARENENEATLRLSSSSFEAGSLTESLECTDNTQTLGGRKYSILGLGLSFRSSMRLPSVRSSSTASSIFLQPNCPSLDALGSRAKERLGSTTSNASSLRPVSVTSSSSVSVSNRQSRGSVKWDEEGLQSDRREIQKEKKEKRQKREDSTRSSEGKRRISMTDVFLEVASSQGGGTIDVGRGEEIHKRFSTAFPIVTIEEAVGDGREDDTEEIHDSLVYGGILKENETKDLPQTTPAKRLRARPMSEQLLGKVRPCAAYEDDEGVLSILDAATNDLAQLINNLDLEATPNTPDIPLSRPVSKDFTDKFNGSPVRRTRSVTTRVAGELGLRPSTVSISSLRPYAQSRGKATKTLTTPAFTSPVDDITVMTKPSELDLGQSIKPWPVLFQQISPVKECHDVRRGDKEKVPQNDLPSKIDTWKRDRRRTMTPGPEPESAPVFHPLRPPKVLVSHTSNAADARSTFGASISSIFTLPTETSRIDDLGDSVPLSSLSRKANVFCGERCSPLPVPVDASMGGAKSTCSDSSLLSSHDCVASVEKRRRMPATLGGSDVSCYAVPEFDASDPDSDIPDELQDILKANINDGSDDDTLDLNKRLIRVEGDSADVEYPRSILPPLDFPDLLSEVLGPPIFDASLGNDTCALEDVDEGEHADADLDLDVDTKQSFDFTGELRRLNESGASDRHSFFEQLECASKTPAMVDLRCDLGRLVQVEVPPVPHLPQDFNVCKNISPDISSDNSRSTGNELTDGVVVAEEHTGWSEGEADGSGAFDIHKVSEILNVEGSSTFDIQSTQSDMSDSNVKRFAPSDVQRLPLVDKFDSSLEVDSADVTGCIIVSTDPTEDMGPSRPSNQSAEVRPMKGEPNKSFKFGGAVRQNILESSHCSSPPLTLSDIIPRFDHVDPLSESSTSSQRAFDNDSLCKSTLTKEPDLLRQRPRVASDANCKLFQAQEAMYRHSHASIASFTGLDSFDEVRRGFEFNSQRPGFYPLSAASNIRADCRVRDSVMSIASVSSYGRVINPGIPDPFDFGLPSLQECPSSEDLSTSFSIDDTFSFLRHPSRTRKRVDSDASGFYFHVPTSRPRDRRRESTFPVAPPVSLLKRSFAVHRDSDGSTDPRLMRGQYDCFNASTESVTSDLSAMGLARPGLGDKMFDTTDRVLPPSSTSSTRSPYEFSLSPMPDQSTLDSILDGDRRISLEVPDSIFDKSGQRISVISESSVFGRDDDACIRPGNLPLHQFRPLSFSSEVSTHSPVKDDDTMISMLGGGHVRRRSIDSIMSGSPCARVEKRKYATLRDIKGAIEYTSPKKTGAAEKSTTLLTPFQVASLSLAQHHPQEDRSSEESCFVGHGEDKSTLFRPAPVFTRPPLASRSRSSTLMSFGDDTPPLSACDGTSISGSSLSSLDLYDVDTILGHSVHSTSTQQHVCSCTRARGHGHRHRYSHIRSSRTSSVYETIQEEFAGARSSPVPSIVQEKSIPRAVVATASVHSYLDDTMSLGDNERGVTALRRYYALQEQAESTVMESQRVWLDTPFSIFAVQSFNPPHHLEGMKALLEDSRQNYGPLPSELRPRRIRSRKDSRPSPYPQLRFVKYIASPETISLPVNPENTRCSTAAKVQMPLTNDLSPPRPANLSTSRVSNINHMISPIKYKSGSSRARLGSNARRTTLGLTQRNGVKESTDTFGMLGKLSTSTTTRSIDQKENLAGMGSILSHENSLRFHRPRPKSRPINHNPAQRPIKI